MLTRNAAVAAATVGLLTAGACGGSEFTAASDSTSTEATGPGTGGSGAIATGAGGDTSSASGGGGVSSSSGAGGSSSGAGGAAWPDSPTIFCSDGVQQVACPAAGSEPYGQDGNYSIDVPTYETTDETAVDSVTGLMWQRATSNAELVWDDAFQSCSDLAAGGFDDWRLPTRLELSSVLDYGRSGNPQPPIAFPNAQPQPYWTATANLDDATGSRWYIDFGIGETGTEPEGAGHYVRCVRGAPLEGAFVPVGDAAVLDERTGLIWQREVDPAPTIWFDALLQCESLALAGADDWRLPSEKELLTIVLETASYPAIDGIAFGLTPSVAFWSSTPAAPYPDHAWVVDFADGRTGGRGPLTALETIAWVRCVR